MLDLADEIRHNPATGARRLVAEYRERLYQVAYRLCLNAAVSSVTPSPFAPKSRTFTAPPAASASATAMQTDTLFIFYLRCLPNSMSVEVHGLKC